MKAERIANLLPEVFRATVGTQGPLDGFLSALQQLQDPCEGAIGRLPDEINPRTATPPFVYLLAHWTDLDYLLSGPVNAPQFAGGVGRLRELVATVARNNRERGTAQSLIRMLETATGCAGFRIETPPGTPFHFDLLAPREARTFEELVLRLVAAEKPAFATCRVKFEDQNP
jgi:phage tail-like protein